MKTAAGLSLVSASRVFEMISQRIFPPWSVHVTQDGEIPWGWWGSVTEHSRHTTGCNFPPLAVIALWKHLKLGKNTLINPMGTKQGSTSENWQCLIKHGLRSCCSVAQKIVLPISIWDLDLRYRRSASYHCDVVEPDVGDASAQHLVKYHFEFIILPLLLSPPPSLLSLSPSFFLCFQDSWLWRMR